MYPQDSDVLVSVHSTEQDLPDDDLPEDEEHVEKHDDGEKPSGEVAGGSPMPSENEVPETLKVPDEPLEPAPEGASPIKPKGLYGDLEEAADGTPFYERPADNSSLVPSPTPPSVPEPSKEKPDVSFDMSAPPPEKMTPHATNQRLRRLMAPRGNGTFLVPECVRSKWKDLATRSEVLALFEKSGYCRAP